jgi:hypothetical protein
MYVVVACPRVSRGINREKRMSSGMKPMVVCGLFVAMLSGTGGCALDAENGEELETDTATAEVTQFRNNAVIANTLQLRSTNSTSGPSIGTMTFCSTFYVDHVDWNTRMAFGYSYQLGRSGWARIGNGSAVYLTASGCISGGGEG